MVPFLKQKIFVVLNSISKTKNEKKEQFCAQKKGIQLDFPGFATHEGVFSKLVTVRSSC